jgi:hypothetical protein
MSLTEYVDAAASPEKAEQLHRQWAKAVNTGTIICGCGQLRALELAYRCLYCGEWYCFRCAEVHFGMTVQQWRESKRVELRIALRGQLFISGEGI